MINEKPIIKLHIVANNARWKSWPSKIRSLQEWFSPRCDLVVTLEHTSFKNIPYEPYHNNGLEYRAGIALKWYDENVSPRGKDSQLVMFVESWKKWKGTGAAGWRTDNSHGPVELQVAADEHDDWIWEGRNCGNWFVNVARHEILHGLFMITGQPDTVHYWWDRFELEKSRDELDLTRWNIQRTLVRALTSLVDLYKKLISSPKDPMDKLIEAIIQVESGGDDYAVGDKHLPREEWAYGPLQIRKPYVEDVNRVYKTNLKSTDMLGNRALSIDTFKKYMSIYATAKRLGREPTQEDIARMHNAGPAGYIKDGSRRDKLASAYWEKVRKYL